MAEILVSSKVEFVRLRSEPEVVWLRYKALVKTGSALLIVVISMMETVSGIYNKRTKL